MASPGWKRLIPVKPPFARKGGFPMPAYSEFMPAPRLGWKPYGPDGPDSELFDPRDPFGWQVAERQEFLELKPRWARNMATYFGW